MMSTMFVIQMYCSGMPIMYLIGFLFYAVTYTVNKILLIKYYKKATTLTRTIPTFSANILKYGLVLHMLNACFMLTQPEIFKVRDPAPDRITLGIGDDLLEQQGDEPPEWSSEADDGDPGKWVLSRFTLFYQ